MPRELQCVAFAGVLSSVWTITASMRASDLTRHARARLVVKPVQPPRGETPAPLAYSVCIHPEQDRDILALRAARAGQNDTRPHRHRLRCLAPRGQRLERSTLVLAQNDLRRRTSTGHCTLPRNPAKSVPQPAKIEPANF
jgi:hypothetical protein